MSMDNKVSPSRQVSPPNGPLGSYPQTTAPNPSQRGMNAPAVPPGHSQSGMDGNGNGNGNGDKPPVFPK
jgi:hypothetical protein